MAEVAPAAQPAPWLTEYWRAWWALHPDRPKVAGGMGPAIPERIPWRDLVLWCDRHPHLDLDLLAAVAEAMDRVFLDHWAAEAQRHARQAQRAADRNRRTGR